MEEEGRPRKVGMRRSRRKAAVTQLPEDVIFEILIRVSCATTLWKKFRCVCKSWCSMISSTTFIQAHLRNSLITSNLMVLSTTTFRRRPTTKFLPLRAFLGADSLFGDNTRETNSYDILSVSHKDAIHLDTTPLWRYYYDNNRRLKLPIPILSTCNGLCLLLLNNREFCLWNPFINLFRVLPDFVDHTDILDHPDNSPIVISFSAFGFDQRSHDYNIVAFIDYSSRKNTTKFYSLNTDSWTRLEDFECGVDHGTGRFLNGEVHWLTGWRSPTTGLRIVSLDLTTQVQTTADLPSKVNRTYSQEAGGRPTLSVHGECLYVLCVDKNGPSLWVRKDNGVQDSSWALFFSICHFRGDTSCRVLCLTEEGEILFSNGMMNLVYSKRFHFFRPPVYPNAYPHADICIQSLVSPFPDGMLQKKSQTRFNASESLTRMKGSGLDTQGHANAGSATVESQNRCSERTRSQMAGSSKRTTTQMARSTKRTKTQMAHPTRRSPLLGSSPSTVYLPASTASSLRRSPRFHHPAPMPSSSFPLRRSTHFHHLPPSPSMAEQDCPGSRF